MPFDVELSFTGLGVVLLKSGGERRRNPNPEGVEFLLLHTPEPEIIGPLRQKMVQKHHHKNFDSEDHSNHESHLPRLWFRLDDLARPERRIFRETLAVDTEGAPVIGLDVKDQRFITITATGGAAQFDVEWAEDPNAVEPDDASLEAIDWIPALDEQFGLDLDATILPGHPNADNVYTSRVILPYGRITTRRFLVEPNNRLARWTFGERPNRVLADQVVWSRTNVDSLEIDLLGGMAFDALFRERLQGQENPRVKLALTNLPAIGRAGRFRRPTHFPHFASLSATELAPQAFPEVERHPAPLPGEITSGGACPPARAEVS